MRTFCLAALGTLVLAGAAQAGEPAPAGQDRLMIVNGNNGRVVYDDGRDDLYCVTRRRVVGYRPSGRPVYSRNMRCR